MAATEKTWINGSPPQVDDIDLNGFKNENNNLIASAGLTLNTSDNNQTAKAVSIYASGGDYYIDSGSVNSYVLTPQGTKIPPPSYYEGMRVGFVPANTNTDISVLDVASLGVKNLKDEEGNVLIPGKLEAGRYAQAFYNGTEFRLIEGVNANGNFIDVDQLRASDYLYYVATGTANAIIVTASPPYSALSDGTIVRFKSPGSNSGAVTLQVDSFPAHPLRITPSVNMIGNEIRGNSIYTAQYSASGTEFILKDPDLIMPIQDASYITALDTGTVNALQGITAAPYVRYTTGTEIWVYPANTNTSTSVTLNVSVPGATGSPVKKWGTSGKVALDIGDIQAGCPHLFKADSNPTGGDWILINPATSVNAHSIQNQTYTYAVDVGTTDNLVANPSVPYLSLTDGMRITVRVSHATTGTVNARLNVSGLGALQVTGQLNGGRPILGVGTPYDFVLGNSASLWFVMGL